VSDLALFLARFRDATGRPAIVWAKNDAGELSVEAGQDTIALPAVVELLSRGGPAAEVRTAQGILYVAAVAGPRRAWVAVGPFITPDPMGPRQAEFLSALVGHLYQSKYEVEHAAYELAERYEEINLLYTTSEIFGSTVTLEDAAARILEEIADTVGARRGALLVHDRVTGTLQVVTSIGFDPTDAPPIAVADPSCVSSRVFREQRAMIVEPGDMECDAEFYRQGSLLSVPILWTNPGNPPVSLGVMSLSERRSGGAFTAGDEKLVAAIATQIGTAIQINRLVRASLSQQRLQQEMQLANDLQMKLLPKTTHFLPEARVAARVVPADSVGGDFYHLFRLGDGKTGVLIGDVSSHGYRAALIMALVMSASSIHAQNSPDPARMLSALLTTLRDELESTEMFISIFYGILDPAAGQLRYANAGHPHAFVVTAHGCVERLAATAPPLGMSDRMPETVLRHWKPGGDLLLLFTDGVSDARNRFDKRLGETGITDVVRTHRNETPEAILKRAFGVLQLHMGGVIRRDDLTLVIART
jgi:sigma-B regulation protein RsbU (phosphoserine phosphatase)